MSYLNNSLEQVVKAGNLDHVNKWLTDHPKLDWVTCMNAIRCAVPHGQADLIKSLLKGLDKYLGLPSDQVLLGLCQECPEALPLVLPSITKDVIVYALRETAFHGNLAVVETLASHLTTKESEGVITASSWAADAGHLAVVQHLWGVIQKLSPSGDGGKTLEQAIAHDQEPIVDWVLARSTKKDVRHSNALGVAASRGSLKFLNRLWPYIQGVPDQNLEVALIFAARENQVEALEWVFERLNVWQSQSDVTQALVSAAKSNALDSVKFLAPHTSPSDKAKAVLEALEKSFDAVVNFLLPEADWYACARDLVGENKWDQLDRITPGLPLDFQRRLRKHYPDHILPCLDESLRIADRQQAMQTLGATDLSSSSRRRPRS